MNIAVQSEASPAAHESWRLGKCVSQSNRTIAEGLATGAQRLTLTHAHTLAEGAGAAAVAALLSYPEDFAGQRIGVVCTGGNASERELPEVLGADFKRENLERTLAITASA